MLAPRPLFCGYQELVEYADWHPRWAADDQIRDPKHMATDLRSTRGLQWKHTVVVNCVKAFTKGYKKKKGFRKTAYSHGEENSHKRCVCEY